MASQSLLHELLLALVGHTGNCIQPILQRVSTDTNVDDESFSPAQFEVTSLELVDESPFLAFLSGADRATINQLLQCGYHYTSILHFTQSVDAGATCDVFQPNQAASTHIATNASDLHRLDIQQQRSVYSAASQMLSPTRTKRTPMEPVESNSSYGFPQTKFGALIPVPSLHPLLDENHGTTQKKAVGLYLRALVIGLDEILIGYRTLILKIEQEILSEYALNPDSATGGPNRITFGLTKLTLMLRQYSLILPALHKMVQEIAQSANSAPLSPTATESANSSSPSRSTHGCALLTFLHKLSQTGVPLLAQVYRRLSSHLDKVLMHQLINWTFYGLLLDPFEEFFIRQLVDQSANAKAEDKKDSNKYSLPGFDSLQFFQTSSSLSPHSPSTSFDWDLTFSLEMSLLPPAYFTTMSLPHQLLFLGKAVKLLGQDERRREERERRANNWKTRPGMRATMELDREEDRTMRVKTRRTGSISHTPAPVKPHVPLLQECQPLLAQFHALRTGSFGDGFLASLPQFEQLIKEYHGIVSRRLYHSLLTDHGLLIHLDHLRRFILLGDGEFTTQFLELSADLLSRPSNPRTEKELNSLNGPVRTALIAAGLNTDEEAGYDEDDELQQIHNAPLQLLKFHIDTTLTAAAQNGAAPAAPTTHHCWKQLAFTYQLSSPLNLIFISDSFTKYNELFRFQFTARRLQFLLKNLWQPMEKGCRKTYGGMDPNHKLNIQLLLLRQNMSFVLDTLCTYIQYDVIETCWQGMIQQIKKNQSFDSIRKAHEDYLNEVIRHCFLRDRAVSGALTDLFDVCLQFTTAYPLTSSAIFTRISSDYVRQSCFLFTVLTRKTDFTGGTSSFLHALVSRLDYNGYFTRMCSELGVNRQTKLVPTTKGTILSTQGIQRSLQDSNRVTTTNTNNNHYGTSHLRTTSGDPSNSITSSSNSSLVRVPASTFRPSSHDLIPPSIHLTSTAYFSQGAAPARLPTATHSQAATRPSSGPTTTATTSYQPPTATAGLTTRPSNKFNHEWEPTSY